MKRTQKKYWVDSSGTVFYVMSRNHRPVCTCWSEKTAKRVCRLLNQDADFPDWSPSIPQCLTEISRNRGSLLLMAERQGDRLTGNVHVFLQDHRTSRSASHSTWHGALKAAWEKYQERVMS